MTKSLTGLAKFSTVLLLKNVKGYCAFPPLKDGVGYGLSVARVVVRSNMLRWSLIFLVIALIAALFGFTTIAGTAMAIGKFLFFLFITIFLVLLILGLVAGKRFFG